MFTALYPVAESGVCFRSEPGLPDGPTAGGDMKWGLEQRFQREVVLGQFLLSVPGVLVRRDAAVLRQPCDHGLTILGNRRTKPEHMSAA